MKGRRETGYKPSWLPNSAIVLYLGSFRLSALPREPGDYFFFPFTFKLYILLSVN